MKMIATHVAMSVNQIFVLWGYDASRGHHSTGALGRSPKRWPAHTACPLVCQPSRVIATMHPAHPGSTRNAPASRCAIVYSSLR